jgi:hypothetical protein
MSTVAVKGVNPDAVPAAVPAATRAKARSVMGAVRKSRGGRVPSIASGWISRSLIAGGYLLLAACAVARTEPATSDVKVCPAAWVPERPPDRLDAAVAAEIYAPENIVHTHREMTGPYPIDVIWVAFHDDSPRAVRQAAVELVCGEVIGGSAVRAGGIYYIRIRHEGTADALHAAIRRLKELPAVVLASPDLGLIDIRPHPR